MSRSPRTKRTKVAPAAAHSRKIAKPVLALRPHGENKERSSQALPLGSARGCTSPFFPSHRSETTHALHSRAPAYRLNSGQNTSCLAHPPEESPLSSFPAPHVETDLHPNPQKPQMRTTLQPPNITLPEEALQKLYAKALRNGMSLKTYIEGLLIEEANAPSFARRVSPSADAWLDNPQNIAAVRRGLQQQAAGLAQTFSIEEIKRLADL